jgi:hypothetical protein
MVEQNTGGEVVFASPWRRPASIAPETAPAGTVAGYPAPMAMDLSADKRRNWAENRAKRFVYGRSLNCEEINPRVAECMVTKNVQSLMAAGQDVKEERTKEGSEKSGKYLVNPSRLALWLTEIGLF